MSRSPSYSGRFVGIAVLLPAGLQQFKTAAADWTPEFSNPDREAVLGVPITLRTEEGTSTNSRISIAAAGCYAFALDATSTSNPVLTVSGRTTGTADPDVFAFARTFAGQATVLVVLNNERAAVDLNLLPGGGIDVQGLVADGSLLEITGATGADLQVSNGRLVGVVPALTSLALVY